MDSLKTLCQLSTQQLITLSEGLRDELRRRAALAELGPASQYGLASEAASALHARLRLVLVLEPSAAPVPDPRHGAAGKGAPTGDTTTTGAAEFCLQCSGAIDLNTHIYWLRRHESYRFCSLDCREQWLAAGYGRQCPSCKEDFGHEGECRPLADPEASTTTNSLRSSTAAAGAARAEGADREGTEGARPESSSAGRGEDRKPTDLGYHLSLLKGGAA